MPNTPDFHMRALSVLSRASRNAIAAVRNDPATDRESRDALDDFVASIERGEKNAKLRARQRAWQVAQLRGETEQQARARLWREALDASAAEQQRELLDSVGF